MRLEKRIKKRTNAQIDCQPLIVAPTLEISASTINIRILTGAAIDKSIIKFFSVFVTELKKSSSRFPLSTI